MALTAELAAMLVEDGFCDLYDIDPESAKPSRFFLSRVLPVSSVTCVLACASMHL